MANDVSIITGIIATFILLGVFLPILEAGYNVTPSNTDVSDFTDSLNNASKALGKKTGFEAVVGSLGFFDIAASILKMFTWTFGALPVWLDLIFIIFRIILIILVVRIIRGI